MKKANQLSPLGAEMVAGLTALCEKIEAGEPVEKFFTVRTVTLDLKPKEYGAADVRYVRESLNASQALLAKFLGVSVKAVSAWEQGSRPVPKIACRYLDDIVAYPAIWRERLKSAAHDREESATT